MRKLLPSYSSVGSPALSSGGDRPRRKPVRLPATHRCSLRVLTTGALDIPSALGPWLLSSRENSHHDSRQPVVPTVNSLSSEKSRLCSG
ncbi:hypothetical protein PBY51_011963 [Eleginops maclovinus]|uniref:Uncharacterized protein n=1 Tax=Eleginops maclovinus TaxID=56733 RepID=A0AAN7XV00_ELEMC|nr:hypothetical protein PBY51_011963 [Eleginops maclovinus]